jgi:lysyl endopeptidase
MRRTAGLATIGLCALITFTGVAGATDRPIARTAPIAEAALTETIGAIETVSGGVLGGLAGRRRMEFHYPGAEYVKVHFSRLVLFPGNTVTVSDRARREVHTYTESPNGLLEDRWAMSITGDTAIVETDSPLGVTVDRVARGFTPGERTAHPAERVGSGREESICGRSDEKADAACYRSTNPTVYERSEAVARLLINGIELCTGWRVGPRNRMLTNNHCFNDNYEARRTEVWFNYECVKCGGWDVEQATKVWGDRVLLNNATLDFTLFTVDDFEEIEQYGYLELDNRAPVAGEELYITQHPRGEPKTIAMDDPGEATGKCAVANPEFDGYGVDTDLSYYCDTDGGSSGSPVLSAKTHKVIGLHHFGGCPNSGVRIDRIAPEIASLL